MPRSKKEVHPKSKTHNDELDSVTSGVVSSPGEATNGTFEVGGEPVYLASKDYTISVMEAIAPEVACGIHYRNDEVRKIYEANGGIKTDGSGGFDLCVTEDIHLTHKMKYFMIDFGVILSPPRDLALQFLLIPRSSTFKNYNILQANSIGLIDRDYCGKDDYIKMAAFFLPSRNAPQTSYIIPKGTRVAQILLIPQYKPVFQEFTPSDKSRNGFGSTGK